MFQNTNTSDIYDFLYDYNSAKIADKLGSKPRVVVGLSGGVDSSVAAAMLVDRGFDVIALTITPFKVDETCRPIDNPKNCCTLNGYADAIDVSRRLNIPHKFMDLTESFRQNVIENFKEEYLQGRTPNPCARCNPMIKWTGILQKADEYGADFVATGHYAKIKYLPESKRYVIARGNDHKKDQSYFLWGLTQAQLSRTIFPLGDLTKAQTRALAEKYDIPIAQKPESQEICFIPNNDYHSYLNKNIPELDKLSPSGDIVMDDKVIGSHQGIYQYTIGQRKGLGLSHKDPLFVKRIDPEKNLIVVDTESNLYSDSLTAKDVNLIKYNSLNPENKFLVKIRYRDEGFPAACSIDEAGQLHIKFDESRRAISPGQSVVMYEGDDLVGGAVIV
ncbi:MAG: tRNA 2-thiouridine(34) synthase MnmA [Candidatus Kapabacteria bacterium]|nr:tRNA 2-thiouridine(34) synthase MnmA [Candidatus Kapabacteria bacterium]